MTATSSSERNDRLLVGAIMAGALIAGATIWLARNTVWAIILLGAFLFAGRVLHQRLERSGRAAVLRSPAVSRAATALLGVTAVAITGWTVYVMLT